MFFFFLFVIFVSLAYLKRGQFNVILVNWSKLSALPWYITAVRNSRQVGAHVAGMVRWLETQNAVPMSQLHVIGFSLGAEVAGFMGKNLAPRKVCQLLFIFFNNKLFYLTKLLIYLLLF